MTTESAATYGWTVDPQDDDLEAGARLKGLPVSATSCRSLDIQLDEKSADLIAAWENEGKAAKLICVEEHDGGRFGQGDVGGAQDLDAVSSKTAHTPSCVHM